MVTSNIETDMDMTNGARGEIVNIILHLNESPLGDEPIVTFQHLPSYILVKLKQTHAEWLEGLDEGVIPVEVSTRSFQIKVRKNNGNYITSVHHQQLSMTATYRFTNYCSQGQALPYVIIDSVATAWLQKLQADKPWPMLWLVASDDSAVAEPWLRYKKGQMVSRPVFWRLEDIMEYDIYYLHSEQ